MNCHTKLASVIALVWMASLTESGKPADTTKFAAPLTPSQALQSFRLADDNLVIELVAAEPNVVSPVAMTWDEEGRLFVVEMDDYPVGPGEGQIRLLQDEDGDGVYERSQVFAGKLHFPSGILPWKKGLFVTAAPNIWYLQDTDGDGKEDRRRVVLSGFNEGNQQLRVNGLLWGLDNWIYGANGRSDGEVRRPGDPPSQAVSIRRRDFRFDPETGKVESVAGFSQFGLARDDWGNRFPSWNTIPLRHVVLEESYLSRNPFLGGSGVANIIDSDRVFRLSPPPKTFNSESVEHFNASCGPLIFRGESLGSCYQGNAFVCEPLLNLVHRRVLLPNGPTFVARRGEEGKEFLASTDPWFHPVNLAVGPDGALYIADFYRELVEHPQFVPANLRDRIDFRKGHSHGRLWRIRAKDAKVGARPRLSKADIPELVRCLHHSNGWWRDTAQRLLIERRERRAAPLLADAVRRGKLPQERAQALWTLHGLNELSDDLLGEAVKGPHPQVREQAVRLCADRLIRSPALLAAIFPLAQDQSMRIRFQMAVAAARMPEKERADLLAELAQRDVADPWMRVALLSNPPEQIWPFLALLLQHHPDWLVNPTPARTQLLIQGGIVVGADHRLSSLAACLELLGQDGTPGLGRLALLAGLGEGLARAGQPLRSLLSKPPENLSKSLRQLEALLARASRAALDEKESHERRILGVRVLMHGRPETEGKTLLALLQPEQSAEVQAAAAQALAILADTGLAAQALQPWNRYTIATRKEIIASLLRNSLLVPQLVEALEREKIAVAEIGPVARESLLRLPDTELRKRAAKLLSHDVAGNRQAVVRKYRAALALKGDSRRGETLFNKHCQNCHQMRGRGRRVGPDLSGVASRPDEALLVDILDPSRDVSPDYLAYMLVSRRGQVTEGLLAAETTTSLTIRRAEAIEETFSRKEIEEFRATRKSLMPEGMEQVLNLQDMADLLRFLRAAP